MVRVFLKHESIAQVHVTAASRGWVIDWDRLLFLFNLTHSFLNYKMHLHHHDHTKVTKEVRRRWSWLSCVVNCWFRLQFCMAQSTWHMPQALFLLSRCQVCWLFFAGFFDWIVEFGKEVWCCDEAVKNMWQNPYSLMKNLEAKGKIIIFASNYELW